MDSIPTKPEVDLSDRKLGDFQLLRRLGQGGMGQVYLAEQVSLKRKVAIKIMRPDAAFDSTAYQRFRAEAEAIARITHANIVQVYAFGEVDRRQYMALEYVEGRSLGDYLKRKGPPDLALALSIMRQVAAGLQRAAELGIIHRDIKPENILITRRGEVKVADFGLSRCFDRSPQDQLTKPGLALGTPLYMSPEQIQGKPVDPRTDVYAFGATAYHMLAGVPPFRGDGALEVAMQHLRATPRPLAELRPDLPAELSRIVHKMMARDPADRYQTCQELLKELTRLRESLAAMKTQASGAMVDLGSTGDGIQTAEHGRPRWLVRVLFTLSVTASFVLGGTLAWRNRASPMGTPAALDEPAQPIVTEQQKQEQFLREAVNQDAEPNGDRVRLNRGVINRIELTQFYLEQHRVADADRYFSELQASPVKVYSMLGRLGHALVLAHQDKAEQSNRLFMELLGIKNGSNEHLERIGLLMGKPQLRYEIARALDRNKVNATAQAPFPVELEVWRTAPARRR
jgi:serine/threonine-protein kinase